MGLVEEAAAEARASESEIIRRLIDVPGGPGLIAPRHVLITFLLNPFLALLADRGGGVNDWDAAPDALDRATGRGCGLRCRLHHRARLSPLAVVLVSWVPLLEEIDNDPSGIFWG